MRTAEQEPVPSPAPRRGFHCTEPSRPDAPNEDAARIAGPVAVLADGAGIPARFRAGCHHSVAWYSHALVDALARELADPATTMRDALAAAIRAVSAAHADTCDLERGGPSATVLALRERDGMLEHLVLCDSSLLLTRRGGEVERITDERSEHLVLADSTPEAIEAMRNAPGGFWLARHEVEAADEAIVGATPLVDLECASLVSDGVTRATDLLGLCTDAELAARCRDEDGASELLRAIRAEESRRAAAGSPVARKLHDDATIVTWIPAARPWSGGAAHS